MSCSASAAVTPLLLLVAVTPLLAVRVPFKDCGSNGSTVKSLDITPCGPGPVCVLQRGKNATIAITFVAKEESRSATASVHGKVAGVPIFVPFNLPDDNACEAGGVVCPVQKASVQHYKQALAIKMIYPAVRAVVKWEILDDSKADIVCLLMNVLLR